MTIRTIADKKNFNMLIHITIQKIYLGNYIHNLKTIILRLVKTIIGYYIQDASKFLDKKIQPPFVEFLALEHGSVFVACWADGAVVMQVSPEICVHSRILKDDNNYYNTLKD